MIGIDYYNEKPAQTDSTLSEILAGMTAGQRTAVLNGYANRPKPLSPLNLKHSHRIKPALTGFLYAKIEAIEQAMKKVMTGNVGGIDPPATQVQLRNYLQDNLASENTGNPDDFNSAQVEAIATKIIQVSKYEGGATFTWYKNNVVYP